MEKITLRQATWDDLLVLYDIATRSKADTRKLLGKPTTSIEEYKKNFEPEKIQVIQYNNIDIGRLRIVRSDGAIYIGGIHILPEFQNKGIGTTIIKKLIEESERSNSPLTLDVYKVNKKAVTLYDRLGFEEVKDMGEKIAMQYRSRRNVSGSN